MRRLTQVLILAAIVAGFLAGCAISGRGNFPHPVWFWECWEKPSPC
jgi:hypothetical protein